MSDSAVLILAAGKGERMRSDLPKVLHPLGGRPLLSYSLRTAQSLRPNKIVAIVGHKAGMVKESFRGEKVRFVMQQKQLGTAHAVLCGVEALKGQRGLLFILYGDVPLIRSETLRSMECLLLKEEASLAFLTAKMRNPTGYGRVIRNGMGEIERIVEEKEAEDWEKEIREINSGIYVARLEDLRGPLARVRKSIVGGASGGESRFSPRFEPKHPALPVRGGRTEYYLTDLIEGLIADGKRVVTINVDDPREVMGVNTRRELALADRELQRRIRNRWMEAGVTMIGPDSIRVDAEATLEPDVILHPGVIITGPTKIGRGAEILPYSVIEESRVDAGARVGPFAHLRPQSRVSTGAHVGNFVELKKTTLGPGAKANHLAYLGDTVVGARANVGAGTITCNYDGFHKYQTIIGERAFIGSDTQLVAPVKVGARAWIGAGTTVTEDVPAGALAISRAGQRNIPGYDQKKRKTVKKK